MTTPDQSRPSLPQPAAPAGQLLPDADADALLRFVLRQARVRTNAGSRQIYNTKYTLEPRVVPDYNFIYVTRGVAIWTIDGTDYPLHPHEMAIVPPGVKHHACSITPEMDLTSLHIDIRLPGGQDVFELLIPPRFQRFDPQCRFTKYMLGYSEEFVRSAQFMRHLITPGWGRILGFEYLWHSARHGLLTSRTIEPLITQILHRLQDHLSEPVTLDDLSQWAGYTPQHLNRVFRRVLGVTPLQYLTRMRLERAAEMLADDQLTLAAISQAVGFEDAYYFSRLFKQHYGKSPAHYRQALEQGWAPLPRA